MSDLTKAITAMIKQPAEVVCFVATVCGYKQQVFILPHEDEKSLVTYSWEFTKLGYPAVTFAQRVQRNRGKLEYSELPEAVQVCSGILKQEAILFDISL